MKKTFTLAVALLVLLSATACTKTTEDMGDIGYKVGVGSYTVTDKSYQSSGTTNGKGIVTTTYVTAVFDSANMIKKVYIDEVESSVHFDSAGQLIPSADGEVRSKRELGDSYNMKAASAIGKEWYEQIDSLEKYLEGKNVMDITAGIDMSNTKRMTRQRNIDSNVTSDSTMTGSSGTTNSSSGIVGDVTDDITGDITSDGSTSGTTDSITGSADATDSGMTGDGDLWQEDLKSSVTIDIRNIKIAIKKAYENAK